MPDPGPTALAVVGYPEFCYLLNLVFGVSVQHARLKVTKVTAADCVRFAHPAEARPATSGQWTAARPHHERGVFHIVVVVVVAEYALRSGTLWHRLPSNMIALKTL